jgi:hypothetical protein
MIKAEAIPWATYVDRKTKSDLWGFVVLDWYHVRSKDHKETPSQFLRTILPRVVRNHSDPVAFHRVLLSVSVQLFGNAFRQIIDLSIFCLKKFPKRPSPQQVKQMVGHYEEYGQGREFALALRSRGFSVERSVAGMSTKTSPAKKGAAPEAKEVAENTGVDVHAKLADLDNRVLEAMKRAALNPDRDSSAAGKEYVEAFRISGKMKGEAFLEILQKNPKFNNDRIAVVSVGGADGSEIAHILQHSNMRYGILLDKDQLAFTYAAEKRATLAALGKTLTLWPGDVKDTIRSCDRQLKDWKEGKLIDGVAYSINATLHELSHRGGQRFDLRHFMHLVVGEWNPFLIAMREPSTAKEWRKDVELKCKHVSQNTLELLAIFVAEKLNICKRDRIKQMSGSFVSMPPRLAVEVLFKLYYIEDLEYEIQESVTSIPTDKLRSALDETLEGRFETTYSNSPSFNRLYEEYGIECRNAKLIRLPTPTVFVSLVGTRP